LKVWERGLSPATKTENHERHHSSKSLKSSPSMFKSVTASSAYMKSSVNNYNEKGSKLKKPEKVFNKKLSRSCKDIGSREINTELKHALD